MPLAGWSDGRLGRLRVLYPLAHLGLATEALTKLEDPIWPVRGPPDELFPPDLDDAGLPVELDAVDEDLSEPFFDELPAEDWAA